MADIRYIDKDFVKFNYTNEKGKQETAVLVFGDKVEVIEEAPSKNKRSNIRAREFSHGDYVGTVKGKPFRSNEKGVLKFSMVDVQQGDGMILETPPDEDHNTRLITIDGGDNKLFARHLAARYQHRKSSKDNPLSIDLMIVTHGDADHFEGLFYIKDSEKEKNILDRQRVFIRPKRIYHNGLVKSAGKINDVELKQTEYFGNTVERNGKIHILDLYDDPRDATAEKQNSKFTKWAEVINHWEQRGNIEFKRVAYGMDSQDLFGFLGSNINVEIQGPFTDTIIENNTKKETLRFFRKPKKSALIHLKEDDSDAFEGESASHTINGHSIAFRLTYGNVRFNFTGDLNQESMKLMVKKFSGDLSQLESEIIKAPHHGSADFDLSALKAMKPVVSLVSSGDESTFSEHIHPRATLVSALGKVSRGDTGIVLCTELAAFFAARDYSHQRSHLAKYYTDDDPITKAELRKFFKERNVPKEIEKLLNSFFAFERKNYGIIHVRTDGERVLVFTLSGKKDMREAYRFTVNENHEIEFADDVETG